MKRITTSLLLATLLGCGLATGTSAQTAEQVKARYDINGDGVLDDSEQAAAKKALTQKFDTDGDGQLSEVEKERAKEQLKSQARKQFDTNGDGKLSEAERKQAKETLRNRFQQRRGRRGSQQ